MMSDIILPIVALAFVYFCLRTFLGLIRHWITNRTIREAMTRHPESVRPLIARLESDSSGWTPKIVGLSIVVSGVAFGLAIVLEKVTGLSPDLLFTLIALAIGLALYLLGRGSARVAADHQASSSMSQ